MVVAPGVLNVSMLSDAGGARFRSERYPDFAKEEIVRRAARNLIGRDVKVVVAIGGNGTFLGIRDLSRLLPRSVQTFFVPVTVDSDISNTECIGQHTGIEEGAKKIAAYAADARAHKRIYNVAEYMDDGKRAVVPAIQGCQDFPLPFDVVQTDNSVHGNLVKVANRLFL